jgi:hypothetical protein
MSSVCAMFSELMMVGGVMAGSSEVVDRNRELERPLACGMLGFCKTAGAKRLEVRSVRDAGSEGVGLREGPRRLCTDAERWDISLSRRRRMIEYHEGHG